MSRGFAWYQSCDSCCRIYKTQVCEVRMFGMPLKSTIPEWVASQTMRSKIVDGLESELLVVKTASLWNSEKLAGSKATKYACFEVYHSRMGGLTNNEVKNRRWIGERGAGAWGGASSFEDSFTLKQREVSRIEGHQHTNTNTPSIPIDFTQSFLK